MIYKPPKKLIRRVGIGEGVRSKLTLECTLILRSRHEKNKEQQRAAQFIEALCPVKS